MKKIRIALLLEAMVGGTRTHLDLLIEYLNRDLYEIFVICSTRRDPSVAADLDRYRQMGVEVHVVPMTRSIRPLSEALNLWRLYRLMRRKRFDLVHTHSSKAGILGRIAARYAGVPTVLHTPHVFAFQQTKNPALRRVAVALERFAARSTCAMVCVSESERNEALAYKIIASDRLFMVPNSVPCPHPTPEPWTRIVRARLDVPQDASVVGTVANFRKQKGLEDFIEAAALICRTHREVIFLMIGTGERERSLRRSIAALGMQDRFRIASSQDSIWDYYECMDVFALSSKWEGMPYALLEAMRMARPVVVTAVGGSKELVEHGRNGLLVPPNQPRTMAEAICLLLENRPLSREMGEAAKRTIVQKYRIEDRIHELEAIYQCAHHMSNSRNFSPRVLT